MAEWLGWAGPTPIYTFIVHALTDKAKPWFRFTRYLPSISLMSDCGRSKRRPWGGWDGA